MCVRTYLHSCVSVSLCVYRLGLPDQVGNPPTHSARVKQEQELFDH